MGVFGDFPRAQFGGLISVGIRVMMPFSIGVPVRIDPKFGTSDVSCFGLLASYSYASHVLPPDCSVMFQLFTGEQVCNLSTHLLSGNDAELSTGLS